MFTWNVEELKYLLAKYDELDKLVEKITKETKIKYWQMCDYDIYYVYNKKWRK